mgnify:CR=1 FL=1
MTVVGERLWRELNNFPCHTMEVEIATKKGIGTAKSFGYKLTEYSLIEEATSYYVAEVADLLRQQNSAATYLEVFLQTNSFSNTIDALNSKFGKNKVKLASVGNREKEWALIKEHRSPRFTTQWKELLTIGKSKVTVS